MRKPQMTSPGISMWVAWSRQYMMTSQPIWCTIDWLGTRQHRERVRVSRSRDYFHYSPLPKPHPEPSNHRGGWVWVFSWHQIYGFSNNHPIPNTQQALTVHWYLIPYLWSQGQCHTLRYQGCPDFRGQPCVLELSCFWPSDWYSKFPSLHLHAQTLNGISDQSQENS